MIYARLIFKMVYNLTIDSSHAIIHTRYFHQPYPHDQPSRGSQNRKPTPPSAESRLSPSSFSTAPSTRPQRLGRGRSRSIRPRLSGIAEESSLRAIQLEPLLDGRSTNENAPHDINRASSPLSNDTVNSPPMSPTTPRPARYPHLQTRMNGHFHQPHTHDPPSPAHSDASPRAKDFAHMSPPGKSYQSYQHFSGPRTPQSEELTPQSEESHLSTSSYSNAPSPHPRHLDWDQGRPILSPVSNMARGSLIIGVFKCVHAGCTAAAFETQHLLK